MITIERVAQSPVIKTVYVTLYSQHETITPRQLELTSFKGGNVEVYEKDEDGIYCFVNYITRMDSPAKDRLLAAWRAGIRRF